MNERKLAIACQGGGSHTAFTAGQSRYVFFLIFIKWLGIIGMMNR